MVAQAVASNVANAAVAVPTVYSSRTKAAFGRKLHISFSDFATSHRFIRSYHNSSNPSHLRVKLRSSRAPGAIALTALVTDFTLTAFGFDKTSIQHPP